MRQRGWALLALTLLLVAFNFGGPPPGAATSPWGSYVPGEVLLKFHPGADGASTARIRADLGAQTLNAFASGAEHWKLGPGVDVDEAIARLEASPLVAYAEPNYVLQADVIPNDPRFPELWGMHNTGQTGGTADADIDADMAWGVSTGSPDVIVGVIDTGIDYNHPDLADNIWTNPGEIAGNGVDDDNNGYVDDIHGWDWVNNDGDPFDDNGHGTHCSGTITGIGDNGVGVAGVAWHVKLMGLKFLSAGGSGSTANAVLAVDYATRMGVDLTSNSWGGGSFSQTLYDAIARAGAADIAFVAAAGNNGTNNDTSPHYPSNYDLPNLISVAATDHNDQKASFSNYGPVSVDIGAPGDDILSTLPGNSYGLLSGTSMATPHVSGVCALIRSVSPNIPVSQLKTVLFNSADRIASMQGLVSSNGRLNAFFAIAEPDDVAPGAIDDLAPGEPTSNTMGISWTASGDDGEVGTASYYQVRYSKDPIDASNFDLALRAGGEPVPAVAGTPQAMEVKGLEANSTYFFAIVAFDEWGNRSALSNVIEAATLPPPTAQVEPTVIVEALFTGQAADHVATLSNIGVGTLDFTIPPPDVGDPQTAQEPLELGKGETDPRAGGPVIENAGGPDSFGYRWVDSDETGGPAFAWTDISTTGTALGITADDATSSPVALGFNMPFYGTLYDSIRVCTNGWLSFTNSTTAYNNQPLPSTGAPENLVAPFWDDLKPSGNQIYFQSFGDRAIVQWDGVPPYSGSGSYTFQAILDSSGAISFQYLSMTGPLTGATVGIQDASRTAGLPVAFNQAYVHDELALRIAAIPQWLTASPNSGRLRAGESIPINIRIDASGLEGGVFPGRININTNDPLNPVLGVDVTLTVTGAPDIAVQPASIAYGERFVNNPHVSTLIVANDGTDVLHVTDIVSSSAELTAVPAVFDVPAHGSQNVTVTWTPTAIGPFEGSLTIASNDAAEPSLVVPVTGSAVTAPVMVVTPPAFDETLYSGNTVTRPLTVQNTGGADLVVDALADQGGQLVATDENGLGSGGPDGFGYRWKDSDESGGPAYEFIDISATGTQITFSSQDDALSAAINMGMTFPFYGNNFASLKVSTNGWLTFDTADTSSRLSNSNLPSTSGAKNMIAMFWDDLHLRTGNVKYQFDGTRFVVQYTNVEKYSPSGNPLVFQVQLYPSGKILLMYKQMGGTVNSATIGIQDGTRTIGLPANYNANYVHSLLAINFSRVPEWLRVTPSHTVVPPGGSFDFTVTFDSNQRNGGDLNGAIVLRTNVPSQAEERVPAVLHVIGAPIAATIPTSYAYGSRFTGYSYLTTMQIVNNGTDVLNVSDVVSSDPTLLVEDPVGGSPEAPQAGFPIPPGEARLMNLRWVPTVPMTLDAQVHVLSDDPVNPDLVMPVTGTAILPPIAVASPDSFSERLDSDQQVHRTLRLQNDGGSDLVFSTSVISNSGVTVPVYEDLEVKKDDPDPREGLLGGGGPDTFGYMWKDSDQPGGPAFAWVDIAATGTPIAGLDSDDESSSPIPLGFSFPFYGNTFDTVRVKTNGFLSFTSTATDTSNDPLPNTGAPENLLAVFWDDLHFRGVERARYLSDGNRFIVQYTSVDRYSSTTPSNLTFQVILYPSGRIVFQYLTMTSAELASATVGIQNAAKNDGLTVVYNAPYMHDNLAVQFLPGGFLPTVTPPSGVVPAGQYVDLDVLIDATGLLGGDYSATIDITTNDPARALIEVPVNLHVTGIPDIDVAPPSLTFPTTFVGFSATQQLQVRNTGTDDIVVTDLLVTGDFATSGASLPFTVGPGASIPVTVLFAPTDEGTRTGVLTVVSNDLDEPEVAVPLTGEGLFPPEIHVTPPAIHTALPPGGRRTKTLNIANAGGSDLRWTAGTSIISSEGIASVEPGSYMDLAKDEADPREGTLGAGGPDVYGYRWTDSDEVGGPVFDWVDIAAIGTPITALNGDDQTAAGVPLGFAFPFYGNSFTTVNVCTNGWLSFSSTKTSYSNQPLPNTGTTVPENLLAVYWDDLHFRSGVHAYYHNDGSRFIVQWNNVERLTAGSLLTFQAILYPNGRVVYQYKSMAGILNSGTIGQQNANRDDGLNVVYNAAYVHDNLAIEIRNIPQWVKVDPAAGTVPESQAMDTSVLLDVAGLEDGVHEATVNVASNDPYTPMVAVPVTVNVSLIEPTSTEFVPRILRFADTDLFRVRMTIELPANLDPHAIRLSSVTLNDTVPALVDPAPYYTDANGNGIEEVTFWFDKHLLEEVLPEAQYVPVTIMGEVEDVQWWRGTDYVRTGDPEQYMPTGGAYYLAGATVPVRWNAASEATNHRYTVQLSRDGGLNWETLAAGLTEQQYDWTAAGAATANAVIRVLSYDGTGALLGEDAMDAPFTLAEGATVGRPFPIDGGGLEVVATGGTVQLSWKAPLTDPSHGPADRYRVLRGSDPRALVEVGLVTDTRYSEEASATAGTSLVYYRIVAVNSAGDAE